MSIERSTSGLREVIFREIELLTAGKVTPNRAAVTAKLVTAALHSASLEMAHARHFEIRDGGRPCIRAISFEG